MSDATLLRLEAKFNANSDREDQAGDRIEELDAKIDRLRRRIRKADRRLDRRTREGSRLFDKIMSTRATTLAGLLVKVRVRDRWATDDEATEITILKSLIADLKAIAGEQP
jgi:chromosome segregation ATPase